MTEPCFQEGGVELWRVFLYKGCGAFGALDVAATAREPLLWSGASWEPSLEPLVGRQV